MKLKKTKEIRSYFLVIVLVKRNKPSENCFTLEKNSCEFLVAYYLCLSITKKLPYL